LDLLQLLLQYTPRSSAMLRPALLSLLISAASAYASAAQITASMTGAWFDPARNGQGIQVQVIGAQQKELLLYWYTFDQAGNPMWLYAQAPVTGDVVQMSAFEVRGPKFMESAANASLRRFGELELSFDDCGRGRMRYSTTLGAGEMALSRLSNTFGAACTGTLVDDGVPVSSSQSDQSQLISGVSISTRYRQDPGKISFKITARGAAPLAGQRYQVWILGANRGTLQMLASGGESEAELEFASPVEPGKLPLNFDPRGATIELRDANGGVVGGGGGTVGGSGGGSGGGSTTGGTGAPPFGNGDQRVDLTMAPTFASGSGDARLKREANKVSFSVEIEDVPIGSYSVKVGGTHRGSLLVSVQNGKRQGELEFSNPQDAGKPLLNFDPRGQLVQLLLGSEVVASVTFVN
jgi:hypothetical protein